jgi:hypothetical protein
MQFDGGEFNWNVLTQSSFLSSLLGTVHLKYTNKL